MTIRNQPEPAPEDRQRLENLAIANDRRTRMATIKDAVHADHTWRELVEVVEGNRGVVGDSLYVLGALTTAPGIGRVKARRILLVAGVSGTARFRELTVRQRTALVTAIGQTRERMTTDRQARKSAARPRRRYMTRPPGEAA